MLYISLPEGWKFDNQNEKFDALTQGENKIDIQFLIKELLRTKKKTDYKVTLNSKETHYEDIIIYFRRPPNDEALYIQYEPKQNGKHKTEQFEIVQGKDRQLKKMIHQVGKLWHQISENTQGIVQDRLDKIQEKSTEQKLNRQKIGNSPNAN
ncbi:MAG: hypothetical protein LCH30_00750 [Proteobacteria bacterium]|nr:hypothetical protein [Pseudomonadota bacterium]